MNLISGLDVVIAALATYRVAKMLSSEEGPFSLFDKFRDLFQKENWIGRGVRCPWCISFWAAMVSVLMIYLGLRWILLWPAISGAAVLLDQLARRIEDR